MEKQLKIDLIINDTQAKQVAKVQMVGLSNLQAAAVKYSDALEKAAKKASDAMAQEARRTADAQAREAKRAADAQAREAKRGADAQVRESKRAEAAASKLTDSVEKAAKKASDSQAREAKKASDASAAAAQNSLAAARKFADDAAKAYEKSAARTEAAEMRATAARAKAVGAAANKAVAETEKATQAQVTSAQRSTRAEEARVARLIGLGKEQLSQTEVGMRAAAIVNQKVQQDRVNAAAKAMSGESKSWLSSIDLSGKATSAVAGFVGGLVAVNGVVSVVGSIAAEFDKVAEKAFLAAQKVAGYRNELRSLAGLEGQAGPTDVTMLKQLDLRLATGATAGQATAFSNEYLGAGQAASTRDRTRPTARLVKRILTHSERTASTSVRRAVSMRPLWASWRAGFPS